MLRESSILVSFKFDFPSATNSAIFCLSAEQRQRSTEKSLIVCPATIVPFSKNSPFIYSCPQLSAAPPLFRRAVTAADLPRKKEEERGWRTPWTKRHRKFSQRKLWASYHGAVGGYGRRALGNRKKRFIESSNRMRPESIFL